MSGAREEILGRIRHALGARTGSCEADYAAVPRSYRTAGELDAAGRLALFVDRLEHYQVGVHGSSRTTLASAIGQVLATRRKRRIVIPREIDCEWLAAGAEFIPGLELTYGDLDRSEGVLTGCTLAIATTGSIVLTHGAGQGRRALTLVPDYHLCVVFAHQIVETVPEAMRRLQAIRPRLVTTIAGPSATADIEMTRIRGVHGPRTLDVIVAADSED